MTTTFVPGAGGGGTQYPDGATQATPTGTAALAKNPSNVLKTLAVDASGNLNVNLAAGSISGGNAAASPTGAAVPASADYTGFNSAGNLVGVSSTNPLPVSLANTGANATALKVDGSAVTQPVSGSLSVSNFPATQPVSGTVTANAGANLNTSALALDVTLTGGTQKTKLVDSGGTNVGAIKAASTAALATDPALVVAVSPNNSVAVTGTFFQGTQPVSIASMPSTPVTGTFFQATQPISAAALPLPSGAATSAKQPALGTAGAASADVLSVQGVASMTALKVDGSAVTQPVSGTFFQATQPVSGTVTSNQGTANATPWNENIAQVGGTAAAATAKGTQATNGIGVQELKDSGRSAIILSAAAIASVTSEALITFQKWVAGVVTTGLTSYTVTTGKTFRITCIRLKAKFAAPSTTVTFANVTFNIRSGALITSPLLSAINVDCAANVPTPDTDLEIPDGLELAAGTVLGISQLASATTLTEGFTIIGFEY